MDEGMHTKKGDLGLAKNYTNMKIWPTMNVIL